jgi:hypothetical protein
MRFFPANQISYFVAADSQCLLMAVSGTDARVAIVFLKTTGVIGRKRLWKTATGTAEECESCVRMDGEFCEFGNID